MGQCLDKGEGVDFDKAAAAGWYKEAADGGDDDAQHNIAVCYDRGRDGVGMNKGLAVGPGWASPPPGPFPTGTLVVPAPVPLPESSPIVLSFICMSTRAARGPGAGTPARALAPKSVSPLPQSILRQILHFTSRHVFLSCPN
jgi:TPR repeat protein